MRLLMPPLLLSLLVSPACAPLLSSMEKPEVDVQDVRIDEISWSGLEGRINLLVFNPNSFGVPLERCDWSIAVGGARAVSGSFDLAETIPAKRSMPVVTTLRLDTQDATRIAARLAAGDRSYRLTGRLYFSTRLGVVTVELAHEGRIEDAPSAATFL